VVVAPKAGDEPVLRGVSAPFTSDASLYKVSPLAKSATPLLTGKWSDEPAEPVAWTHTHKGGRIFFTSLGAPDDFKLAPFRRLLANGVLWALDKPVPAEPAGPKQASAAR